MKPGVKHTHAEGVLHWRLGLLSLGLAVLPLLVGGLSEHYLDVLSLQVPPVHLLQSLRGEAHHTVGTKRHSEGFTVGGPVAALSLLCTEPPSSLGEGTLPGGALLQTQEGRGASGGQSSGLF